MTLCMGDQDWGHRRICTVCGVVPLPHAHSPISIPSLAVERHDVLLFLGGMTPSKLKSSSFISAIGHRCFTFSVFNPQDFSGQKT